MGERRNVIYAAVAVLCAAGAVTIIAMSSSGPSLDGEVQTYYFDLRSGELFAAEPGQLPPIPAPGQSSGETPAGVRAVVAGCGGCDGETFVAWIERYNPEDHETVRSILSRRAGNAPLTPDQEIVGPEEDELLASAEQIAAPPGAEGGDVEWHVRGGPQAAEIQQAATAKCGDVPMVYCTPTR